MEQIVDAVPLVPFLDDLAPQMVEQLPDVLRFFDALMADPSQVIEVPKILPEDVHMRPFLVEAFKIFAQDRVHPLHLTIQLVFMKLWMGLVQGFSHFSPN